jgi:hypothetical protein
MVLLFTASFASAQDLAASPIAKTLEQLLAGKVVRTKRPIVRDFHVYRSGVDYLTTEFCRDGTVQYHFEHNRKVNGNYESEFTRPYELRDNTKVLSPGSEIQLSSKFSYFPDRIMLGFTPMINGTREEGWNPGSISLMLDKGYETWPQERILAFLYTIISIPEIDQVIDWERQYGRMTAELKSHAVSVQSSSPYVPLDEQIVKAEAYSKLCSNLVYVAEKLRSIRDSVIASDSTDYEAVAREARDQVAKLRQKAVAARRQREDEARAQHLNDLQLRETRDAANVQKLFLQLDKSTSTLETDLTKRSSAIRAAQDVITDWQECVEQLAAANQDTTASRKLLNSANQHILRLQTSLNTSRSQMQSKSIDAKYGAMVTKLAQLKSAYATSFGTPKADTVKGELREQLSQMIANRVSSAAMGNSAANHQAEELRMELGRLH